MTRSSDDFLSPSCEGVRLERAIGSSAAQTLRVGVAGQPPQRRGSVPRVWIDPALAAAEKNGLDSAVGGRAPLTSSEGSLPAKGASWARLRRSTGLLVDQHAARESGIRGHLEQVVAAAPDPRWPDSQVVVFDFHRLDGGDHAGKVRLDPANQLDWRGGVWRRASSEAAKTIARLRHSAEARILKQRDMEGTP